VGGGGVKVGGDFCVAHAQKKINSPWYTQSHGALGMKFLLELNCSPKFAKRAWTRLFIPFENFKISQLEQEIQLSKL
jgi:hypothetical protein